MNSKKTIARWAGFHYLMYFVTTIAANELGRFVFVDATVTVNQMLTHVLQFRIGLLLSLASVVFFLLAAWYLYRLLKPVDKDLALLLLLSNLGGFSIWCLSLLNLLAGLQLLSGADHLMTFQPDQLLAQAMVLVNLRRDSAVIAQIPFGIWLLPLGYLVLKSGFLPRILGLLLIADGFGLLIYVTQYVVWPGYGAFMVPFLAVSFVAEASLTLWLLIVGAVEPRPIAAVAH